MTLWFLKWNKSIRTNLIKVKEGGPIGMELTYVVAQVFMVCWDRQLQGRHEKILDEDALKICGRHEHRSEEYWAMVTADEEVPLDERTMQILRAVKSHIDPYRSTTQADMRMAKSPYQRRNDWDPTDEQTRRMDACWTREGEGRGETTIVLERRVQLGTFHIVYRIFLFSSHIML